MPNLPQASQWTIDTFGTVRTLTLNSDAQGNLVNSTLGNNRISGTFNSNTGELNFVEEISPYPLWFSSNPSYQGYIVNAPPGGRYQFNLCGLVQYNMLAQKGGWPPTWYWTTVQSAWIAFFPLNNTLTNGAPGLVVLPSGTYFLVINGPPAPLNIAIDANGNLTNVNLGGMPLSGQYDKTTGKLTFLQFYQVDQIFTFDSFTGYVVTITDNGFSTLELSGIAEHTVVRIVGGVTQITQSEFGWWAFPKP